MVAQTPIELAERVAQLASKLGIETALIGAYALAAHHYVRGTDDVDLATNIELADLRRLQVAVEEAGLYSTLRMPDDEDPLGGVLVVWLEVDDDGDPIEPCEVINFVNPYRPRTTPANDAIRNAISLGAKSALRYPRLADLIALKLYSGGRRDTADVVELLVKNPTADVEEVRQVSKAHGFDQIDDLIEEANSERRRRRICSSAASITSPSTVWTRSDFSDARYSVSARSWGRGRAAWPRGRASLQYRG